MLFNADLLAVDDVALAKPVRCSLGVPTTGELETINLMGLDVSAVLYLPASSAAAAGPPAVGQQVTVRLDGMAQQAYGVLHANDRVGDVLSHRQLFLGEGGG